MVIILEIIIIMLWCALCSGRYQGYTYSSRARGGGDSVVPHPLGVGLLHGGLLHVLALGEDLLHRRHVVGTHRRQAHVPPERTDPRHTETQRGATTERMF